jgi:hypothetical protein
MGSVFRAEDTASKRIVALKQLKSNDAGPKRGLSEALFEREYHTLVRLKHPRIIEVYDYGRSEQGPYYTMELLDGKDLQQLAPLPFREACRHLRDVASSLALLHAQRLVHRDVSPRNVRLSTDGRAKLIDFGALTSFGAAADVIGTPPCMAPEIVRRLPLDQRTDLFALGATSYWALTGRHAYPARKIQELPTTWERMPPLPSQIVADIPHALDVLVMSLLSLDPLARAASAAAVIDQLTAIAGLEAEEHDQAAASYLSSTKLVGRGEEHARLRERVVRALSGRGSEIVIEGPSGIGKTRLLHEMGVEGQLRGAHSLRADAQASSRPFGVAVTLAEQLLDILPEVARRALGSDAALIAGLAPELANKLGVSGAELSDDLQERRARFQTALHEWFLAVAVDHTLLVAVDNIHAADDNSAAFVAALGHEARDKRLCVIAVRTTGENVVAEVPLRALNKRAARIKLAGLSAAACEELVCSLFGNVANTGRMAKLLYDKSAGNPQLCMDLATLLVKRKIAKYVDGGWVLPLELASDELPSRADELFRTKLAEVSPDARTLCEVLSIHDKRVALEHCRSLAQHMDERALYLALDELVAEHILLVDQGRYGFRQQTLRESVLGQMDDARRRSLHLQAAEALLADGEQSVSSRMDAAWHLLRAGEETRGADLMAGATREFLRDQGVESVEQVVQGIDTALALYEKQQRSKYEIASLLFPLMSLAFFVDWRITLKHGERAIRLGLDITGLGLAQRLSRFLPDKLALGLGLVTAAVRFLFRPRGLKFGLIEAIEQFCGLVPAATGTRNLVFDLEATREFRELLAPLKLFGKEHIASLMYDFTDAQYLMSFAREAEATEVLQRLQRAFPDPRLKLKEVLGEAHYKAMYGGVVFSLGILYPYEFGQQALEAANELEQLGVRVWAMTAEEVRMLYHALRGEAEAVQRCHERVELFAVQGSTTWQADIFWPILLLDSETRVGDAIAARTIREQLARRAKDHPSLQAYAEIAHLNYLALRGEHAAAISGFERLHAQLATLDPALTWPAFRASFVFASALNAVGDHAGAKRYASESLRRAGTKDAERVVVHYFEPQRQLALAEAGLGNHDEAVRILDGMLSAHGHQDQPLLIGMLHKARAEVALMMNDHAAFTRHFAEMSRLFHATKNPSLIAHCGPLAKRGKRAAAGDNAAHDAGSTTSAVSSTGGPSQRTFSVFSDVHTTRERAEIALRLVLNECGAQSGYLYLRRHGCLELAAASTQLDPSPECEAKLRGEISLTDQRRLESDDKTVAVPSADDVHSQYFESVPPADATPATGGIDERYRFLVLSTCRGGDDIVVGGLIIELDASRAFKIDAGLLAPIAAALLDGGAST